MRVAYLVDNVVIEMREIHRPISDYPQVHLVEAGEEVVTGFTYDGSVFSPHSTHQTELDAAAQSLINAESLAYLTSTDWYEIREWRTGVVTPQEIVDARAASREAIV